MSQRTLFVLGIALIVVLSVSIVATIDWVGNVNSTSEFFVGVEFAYDKSAGDVEELVGDLKDMVDKVKDYTNLFVIGSLEISFNRTALDAACDYVVDSGLYLIVFFTDLTMYNYTIVKNNKIYNYTIFDWMVDARQKYGDKFLGVYRYDEPGGNQLDLGPSLLIEGGTNYTDVAANYTNALNLLVDYYKNYSDRVFTADYGLYWFDYKAGYDAVFADFGFNLSRPLNIALCRGAATAQSKDWGAIVTWTHDNPPYIESWRELYNDMVLAYKAGAKYVVVFDYPKILPYGILTEDHFDAMKDFWNYVHSNPQEHGVIQGELAYVLPQDYGFGFRNPGDTIWGLWNAYDLSAKVWDDANILIAQYGSSLDIVYDDAETMDAVKSRYAMLFFWNETVS
jgi:hypothetical protein